MAQTAKASDLIIPKLDELTKQFNEFSLSMVTQFAQVHEELNALKEKLAAAPKKPSTRTGASKTTQAVSPTGKKTYSNKMIWWKDMFAAHYEQFVKELFTTELESDGFIAEAEEAMQDPKNKDKVGEARYKAMADYIWKTKIKEDGCKKFRDAVFKKFEDQKNSGGDGEEATAEDNDGDAKPAVEAAEPESETANDNAEADEGDGDAEEEAPPPKAAAPKKGAKAAATPAKTPAKPTTKGPAKGATKVTTKAPAKGAAVKTKK